MRSRPLSLIHTLLVMTAMVSGAAVLPASAQTETVLFSFTGTDGAQPSGLIADRAGNFYGVTRANPGSVCCGTVYQLSLVSGQWQAVVLHQFTGGLDGSVPVGTLAMDARGNLFGVTQSGGLMKGRCYSNCGTVFELSPTSGGEWNYAQIYSLRGAEAGDGEQPDAGVILDSAGNLYGTTQIGGAMSKLPQCPVFGCGTVFELSPSSGGWKETVLYKFSGGSDGAGPRSPVLFDAHGNLLGATGQGGGGHCNTGSGTGCGTIFQLIPSSGAWTENVLHRFNGSDGDTPYQALTLDAAGNLFGSTNVGGTSEGGVVYELSPGLDGNWTETTLHDFISSTYGIWPAGGLTMDSFGNLYGTASAGGADNAGTIFKLTPNGVGFSFSLVNSFDGAHGGSYPDGNLLVDRAGNLYGTAGSSGVNGYGVVFKVAP